MFTLFRPKMYVNKTIIKVFVSCCTSAFLMEILMTRSSYSSIFITFLQFFFIALQGFIFSTKCGTIAPKIPIHQYIKLVCLFFISSLANNYVYSLHVTSTLHMIIRSASSPASMLVSWYEKNQVPKLKNVIGSILITIGVALAMYGGATILDSSEPKFFHWCIGVAILLSTLLTGAYTGLQQEMLYKRFGKHPHEMLFYTNAIPLPLFLIFYPQLRDTAMGIDYDVWFIIALNIVSQFFCTRSVHELATKETSVTVTFILTLRKFVSLLMSSIVFKNTLTYFHVIGTILVVIGTYVYFDFFTHRKQQPVRWKND